MNSLYRFSGKSKIFNSNYVQIFHTEFQSDWIINVESRAKWDNKCGKQGAKWDNKCGKQGAKWDNKCGKQVQSGIINVESRGKVG
jgi:hypothetical protein